MEQTYMTELNIPKVRHLTDIKIPLSAVERKHLILTGKNGSGKTSVLRALANHLDYLVSNSFELKSEIEKDIDFCKKQISTYSQDEAYFTKKETFQKALDKHEERLKQWISGAVGNYTSIASLREKYTCGEFILAYYGDKRDLEVKISKNIEKIELKSVYPLKSYPGQDFVKYLVNLKTKQAFAQTENDPRLAAEIKQWFERFQRILQSLYSEPNLKLEFNTSTFEFNIILKNREPFDFNTMSMGYSAVFDIICDLIMRMEASQNYNLEGIVLIDEIESHLHVELQRKIMPILVELFPNIQFILTTHSPFILNSMNNAVVYDLETQTLIEEGLSNYTYNGIVEGFFDVDTLSAELRQKYDRYKELITKERLLKLNASLPVKL